MHCRRSFPASVPPSRSSHTSNPGARKCQAGSVYGTQSGGIPPDPRKAKEPSRHNNPMSISTVSQIIGMHAVYKGEASKRRLPLQHRPATFLRDSVSDSGETGEYGSIGFLVMSVRNHLNLIPRHLTTGMLHRPEVLGSR